MWRTISLLPLGFALAVLTPGPARAASSTTAARASAPPSTAALDARGRAAEAWRRAHPWPPWWAQRAAPGPDLPGASPYHGPPAPGAAEPDIGAADPRPGSAPPAPGGADYVAQARAQFSGTSRLYASTHVVLRFIEPLYAVIVALLVLSSGMSSSMRDLAERWARGRYGRTFFYLLLYSAIGFALAFPLLWFEGYALEHRFMLSTQPFGGWLEDQLKGVLIEFLALGVLPLLVLALRVVERSPRAWWAWLSLASLPLIVVSMWVVPVLVDPAFNRFEPLRDPGLRGDILTLAARAGIPDTRIYEVNRSEQTRKLNAYVNGFGSSHRIVLWDTAIESFRRDELRFVTGHEIGHYRLGHIAQGMIAAALLTVAGFFLTWWIAGAAVRRFGADWGLRSVSDLAALPLLAAVLTLLSAAGEPIANAWSRRLERDADLYGLEITRDNDAAARAFVRMSEVNRSDPDPPPVVRTLFYSHPTIVERIRLAESYHPWLEGRPTRYFHGPPPPAGALPKELPDRARP